MISKIEREEVAKFILYTEDEVLFDQIKGLINVENSSLDNLPEQVKEDIKISINELEAGLGIPHEEVMKQYKKWL